MLYLSMPKKLHYSLLCLFLVFCGCASLFRDPQFSTINIKTVPPGAAIYINDRLEVVWKDVVTETGSWRPEETDELIITPAKIRLPNGDKTYAIRLEKEGYYPAEFEVGPRYNPHMLLNGPNFIFWDIDRQMGNDKVLGPRRVTIKLKKIEAK